MNRVLSLASICLGVALTMPAKAAQTDWSVVDTILTRTGAVSGDVHRYGLPRSDLNVSLDGVALKPGFALGGWVAFEPMGDKAMMMGDLVLTESEINPVMGKLLAEGLQVTALHNHLLRANPPTFYMHVAGTGDPAQLARLVRAALEESKTPFDVKPPAEAAAASAGVDFDTAKVDAAIGHKGKANGGVYQFGIPRADSIKMDGMAIPWRDGNGDCDQFPADGRRQGGDHRRFRRAFERIQSAHHGAARQRDRGDGHPQSHGWRRAARVLRSFLGEQRRDQAREWPWRGVEDPQRRAKVIPIGARK